LFSSEGSSESPRAATPTIFSLRGSLPATRLRGRTTCAGHQGASEDGRPARPSVWPPPSASVTRVAGQLGGVGPRRRLLCAPEQESRRRSPSLCQPSPAAAPPGRRAPLHYVAPQRGPAQVPDNV